MYVRTHKGLGRISESDTERLIHVKIAAREPPIPGRAFGISVDELTEYDSAFRGNAGERFKKLVEWAAKEVDINPGILAANLISETRRGNYMTRGKMDSFTVGADDFFEQRHRMAKKVPAFAKVTWTQQSKTTNINERDREVVTIQFNSGRDALLGSAVSLKHGEIVLREAAKKAGRNFDGLPVEVRFTLIRRAFNAGHRRALDELREALEGKEVLVRDPEIRCTGENRTIKIGRRCATIRAAQGIHLSGKVFGVQAA